MCKIFNVENNCTILLVGDFNSRTGQMQDFDKYIFDDGSREVLQNMYTLPESTGKYRASQDLTVNSNGKK